MISSFRGDYAFLSNFWEYNSFVAPWFHSKKLIATWRTAEHYFQAAKTKDLDEADKIYRSQSAEEAKRLGRSVKLVDDWEQIKIDVMRKALREKFDVPIVRKMLLETNEILVEGNTWGDTFWGAEWIKENQVVKPGETVWMKSMSIDHPEIWLVGKNMLGILLMELRGSL